MSKEYSREAFEEAKKQADHEEATGTGFHPVEFAGVHAAEADVWTNWVRWRQSGQARVEALMKAGRKEADKLNERYNQLRREADEAEEKLRDFCQNELGMKPEDPQSE